MGRLAPRFILRWTMLFSLIHPSKVHGGSGAQTLLQTCTFLPSVLVNVFSYDCCVFLARINMPCTLPQNSCLLPWSKARLMNWEQNTLWSIALQRSVLENVATKTNITVTDVALFYRLKR